MKSANSLLTPTPELPPAAPSSTLPSLKFRIPFAKKPQVAQPTPQLPPIGNLLLLADTAARQPPPLRRESERIDVVFKDDKAWVRHTKRHTLYPRPMSVEVHIMGTTQRFSSVRSMYEFATTRYAQSSLCPHTHVIQRIELVHRGRRLHPTNDATLLENGILDGDQIEVRVSARLLGGMMSAQYEDVDLGEVDDLIAELTQKEVDRHAQIRTNAALEAAALDAEDKQRPKFIRRMQEVMEPFSPNNFRTTVLSSAVSMDYAIQTLRKYDAEIKLAEDVLLFLYDIVIAKKMSHRVKAVIVFAKARSDKSFTGSVIRTVLTHAVFAFFGVEVQSTPDVRKALLDFKSFKNSEIVARIHKISIVALGASVFDKIGMKVNQTLLHELANMGVEKCSWKSVDFIHLILESLQFVCERGYQCMQMGTIQPLFHSGKSYEEWFDEVRELQRLSKILNNLHIEGISDEEYAQRLDKAIEMGEAIRTALGNEGKEVKRYAASLLCDVRLLRSQYRARNDASASRPEPFGVLLYGGSSVMKSELRNIIFYHYGKLFNLPTDDEYCYVRNYLEEHWSGYRASRWCIHLDDIAPYKPDKMMGPDPSVSEMLQIVNTTAYITLQAELEDKGMIALRPRLVTATTNTEHLNASVYYMNSLAVRRRMPFLVQVEIKSEYMTNGMVDSTKIPPVEEGEYLNVWDLTVKEIIGRCDPSDASVQLATTRDIARFSDIDEFLNYFGQVAKAKAAVQTKARSDRATMRDVPVCARCFRSMKKCGCVEIQAQPEHEHVTEYKLRNGSIAYGHPVPTPFELAHREDVEESKEEDSTFSEVVEHGRCLEERIAKARSESEEICERLKAQALTYGVPWKSGARFWPHKYSSLGWVSSQKCPYCRCLGTQCKCQWHTVACQIEKKLEKGGAVVTVPFLDAPVEVLHVFGEKGNGRALCWFIANSTETTTREEHANETCKSLEEVVGAYVGERSNWVATQIARICLKWYLEYNIVRSFLQTCMGFGMTRCIILWFFSKTMPRACRPVFRFLGDVVQYRRRNHVWIARVLCCASVFIALWSLSKLAPFWESEDTCTQDDMCENKKKHKKFSPEQESEFVARSKKDKAYTAWLRGKWLSEQATGVQHVEQTVVDAKVQTREIESAPAPDFPAHAKEFVNQWDLHDLKLADRPDSAMQISWKGLTDDEVVKALTHSMIIITTRPQDGQKVKMVNRALCVVGQWYVTNKHSWRAGWKATLTFGARGPGITAETVVDVDNMECRQFADSDVVFVKLTCIPPRRDIRQLFISAADDSVARGMCLVKQFDGSVERRSLVNVRKTVPLAYEGTLTEISDGFTDTRFEVGDCGSVWIGRNPKATFIVGIHYYTDNANVAHIGCARVTQQMMSLIESLQVQGGTPMLEQAGHHLTIVPLRKNSHVTFVESGSAIVYGSKAGFKRNPKSTVQSTCIRSALEKRGITVDYAAPAMDWRSYHKDLVKRSKPNTAMNDNLLNECVDAYLEDIRAKLPQQQHFVKCSRFTAINGQDGVAYVDAMNRKTSAGSPFYTNKKKFMVELESGKWDVTPEIHEVIDHMEAAYMRGERVMPLYATAQKDEPKPREKCADGARIFICSSLPWNILVRCYTLWFVRLCQNNRLVFEMAVGINPHSIEWAIQAAYILTFDQDMCGAGDFSGYDKQMAASVIVKIFGLIARLARDGGATDEQCRVIMAIGYDIAFSFVDYDGTMIEFLGSNPSGHVLTVLVNCLVHSVYKRYVFAIITKRSPRAFQLYVRLLTYGDDGVMSVSRELPEFNHTSIQAAYAQSGIVYTMADKESESIPFIHFRETTFLKRGWKVVDGRLFAPLEKLSIWKSLSLHVMSGSLCEEAQTVQAIGSAVRESAYHGKEFYDEVTDMLREIVEECNLTQWVEPATFPSYQSIIDRWELNSQKILEVYESRGGVPGLGRELSEVFAVAQLLTEE